MKATKKHDLEFCGEKADEEKWVFPTPAKCCFCIQSTTLSVTLTPVLHVQPLISFPCVCFLPRVIDHQHGLASWATAFLKMRGSLAKQPGYKVIAIELPTCRIALTELCRCFGTS